MDKELTDDNSQLVNGLPLRYVSAIKWNIMIGQFFPITFPAQVTSNIPFWHSLIAKSHMIAAKDALATITSCHLSTNPTV
jgi:hypothetical protein